MRAVIYCRVSTKEQTENLSLPTQEKACREFCERNGLAVDRIFVEEGESAKTTERAELQRMLAYCRQYRSRITHVIVYAVNRLARDKFGHFAVRAILSGLGITLRSVTEPIDDTSTGKFMEGVLAAVAQFDNDVRSERVTAGMRAALERGRWPFQPPLGYCKKNREMIPDECAQLVQLAYETYAGGETIPRTLAKVTALGLRSRRGKKLSIQSFHFLLRNAVYAGRLRVGAWELETRGSFPAIVSDELFERVQQRLLGKRAGVQHQRPHDDFPLRHFARCVCGRPLTAGWSKGRSKTYAYYHCPGCQKIRARRTDLENAFTQLLDQLRPRENVLRLFNRILLDVWRESKSNATRQVEQLDRRVRELRARKERLVETFVYGSAIDRETYDAMLAKLNEELHLVEWERHEGQLEELDLEAVVAFAEQVLLSPARIWVEFNADQKRRFQAVLFPAGVEFDGREFRTAATGYTFTYLREIPAMKSRMVHHVKTNLNRIVGLYCEMYKLRKAA